MIIVENGFAFRYPSIPSRYRANCKGEWGYFVTGETGNMNCLEAEKAGLLRGNYVEMAVTWIDKRTLSFLPHYENEVFTEIWGFPVAGEIKNAFAEKCTELSTFLIHRRSQDKLKGIVENFSRQAFNSWVNEGMIGDPNEYATSKACEAYFNNIFCFSFEAVETQYGKSFYIQTTHRPPVGDFEIAALSVAKQTYQQQISGNQVCTDNRLVENEMKCLGATTSKVLPMGENTAVTVPVANSRKSK
ncbi:hypothetical protein PN499_22140 [Kamptonema animale CS-326]|jgi:hypothetical protein|uniref:hypothetical protein n=1 Tax=Kamptonema animale TaxID=92934 RepID=UPI00232DA22D|nr:hypothetical protein [Kamptonema animale]MDB9513904.1 hypothetical protein [Kamptonema animale CS-326]